MREVMGDTSLVDPFSKARNEIFVIEVFAPESAEFNPGLDEGAIEIEKTDQAGPLAAPVRDGQDGASMAAHAWQHVMAVLPGGRSEDKIRFRIDTGENIHSHPLAGDEAVPDGGIGGKRSPYRNA